MTTSSPVKAATTPRMPRHPMGSTSTPPRIGATTGAIP